MKEIFSRIQKDLMIELKTLIPQRFQPKVITQETAIKPAVPASFKKIKDFKWPVYKIPKLNTTFTNYFYSIKDEKSELFSKSNLMFVIGPEKVGKSWFVKYNLRFFDNHNQLDPKPFIMHWDLAKHNLINFDAFIHHFEQLFITSLANRWKAEVDKNNHKFLTVDNLLDVVLSKYDPNFVKYYLSKSLKAFVNEEEHFQVEGEVLQVFAETLGEINHKINVEREYIHDKLKLLISLLEPQFQNNKILAGLMFLRSIMIAIELEQRPELYLNLYYRNGIESLDFLLDVVNYISGFHKSKHYTDMDPQTPEYKNLIHSLLVIENFDALLQNGYNEKRTKDFLDHIILRLYDDLRMRTHFPIVIETNSNRFFTRLMFDYLHEREDTSYPALEVIGWMDEDQDKTLSHIFTQDQLLKARGVFGSHLKDWHDFTNVLLNAEKPDFNEALELNSPAFQKEKIVFRNKLNKLYTHPQVVEMLDKGHLDFVLLDFFEKLCSQLLDGLIFTGKPLAQTYIYENPAIKALIDVGILYDRKYFSILQLHRKTYTRFVKEWIREKKSKMSLKEKYEFRRFRKEHGMGQYMFDLHYGSIVKNKYVYEEPKWDMAHEIRDYHPNNDPDTMMRGSPRNALFL